MLEAIVLTLIGIASVFGAIISLFLYSVDSMHKGAGDGWDERTFK